MLNSVKRVAGIGVLSAIVGAALFVASLRDDTDPSLRRKEVEFQTLKYEYKIARYERRQDAKWYVTLGMFGIAGACALVLSGFKGAAMLRKASVHPAKIGNSEIPVHQRDLSRFFEVAVNLSVAEIQASVSTADDERWGRMLSILGHVQKTARALNPGTRKAEKETLRIEPEDIHLALPAMSQAVTLPELYRNPEFHLGLIPFGRDMKSDGLVQMSLHDVQSGIAVGIPGTGKSHLFKNVIVSGLHQWENGRKMEGWVVDPHFNAPRGLTTFLKPVLSHPFFTKRVLGRSDIRNGKHIALLEHLVYLTDKRQEQGTAEPFIVLVIDELRELCADPKYGKDMQYLFKEALNAVKFGVAVFGSTQDPTISGLGDSGVKDMAATKFVFQCNASKSRPFLGEDAKQSERLLTGQCIIVKDGQKTWCQTPQITEGDLSPYMSQK